MNLSKRNCYVAFLVAFLNTFLFPIFFPSVRLIFFIPYVIILMYKQSYFKSLWGAFLCGLAIDLASSQTRIGFHALSYTVTLLLLYKYRLQFFCDSQSTLPVLTFLFSVVLTLLNWGLMLLFEKNLEITYQGFITDLIVMPLLDGIYAYLFFVLPWVILYPKPRKGSDYFV